MGEGRDATTALRGSAGTMDVKTFAEELLSALAETGRFERVALQTEGPTEV